MSHLHPLQIEAWKKMTPDEKWQLVNEANALVRKLIRAGIKMKNPHFTESELESATSKHILRAQNKT